MDSVETVFVLLKTKLVDYLDGQDSFEPVTKTGKCALEVAKKYFNSSPYIDEIDSGVTDSSKLDYGEEEGDICIGGNEFVSIMFDKDEINLSVNWYSSMLEEYDRDMEKLENIVNINITSENYEQEFKSVVNSVEFLNALFEMYLILLTECQN